MADDIPRRGRRRSRRGDQIRDEMITAGLELLAERGVTVGLDLIRFDDVIIRSGVPRASAYRAWKREDTDEGQQVLFHDALAAAVVAVRADQPATGVGIQQAFGSTMDAVKEVLDVMPDLTTLSDTERGFWLRQLHRAGSNANQHAVDQSGNWLSYVAISAGLASQKFVPEELIEAWRQGETHLSTRFIDLYQAMAQLFGFRLRGCYRWEHLAVASAALGEGLAIRAEVNDFTDNIMRQTGPDGTEEPWTLFAVAFEGLLRQFMEPDPAAELQTSLEHEPYS